MRHPSDMAEARAARHPISVVTCYDAWSAKILAASRVDALLVGDSAAMVMHGHDTTIPADLDMMCLHTAAARRGAPEKLLIADMPFLAHRKSLAHTMGAVERLVRAGGQAVKIEGADGNLETIRHIVDSGIDVMGHLGLTPQSLHRLGGYRVQGRNGRAAAKLADDALRLQDAGCFSIVLELVPSELARSVTESLEIPTIGIGAGAGTDAQVIVWQDMAGLTPGRTAKFVKKYADVHGVLLKAAQDWSADVVSGAYPAPEHTYT
jgi:3-methyl-2-oxobutanoate hydroxymethyltransferase